MNDSNPAETIRDLVTGLVHHIDRKRWDDLARLFAPEVETDYTSLFGGAPVKQTSSSLISGWHAALASVTTQHLLGPIAVAVSRKTAQAACHVRALHYLAGASSGETWEVLGHYRFELDLLGSDWRIARMTLETFHQLGNPKLLAEVPKATDP